MTCGICKTLAEHPDAVCFIVDVHEELRGLCSKHDIPASVPVKKFRDYKALNEWASTLDAGRHIYQITG